MPPQQKYIKDKIEAQDRTLMQQKKAAQTEKKKGFFLVYLADKCLNEFLCCSAIKY